MTAWLHDLRETLSRGDAACMILVADARGSTPREAGARMIVTAKGQEGTIGGGQLEFEAVSRARKMLAGGPRRHVLRLSLGPELSQCCGGAVTLLLEPYAPVDLAWLDRMIAALKGPGSLYRKVSVDAGDRLSRISSLDPDWPDDFAGSTEFECRRDGDGLDITECLTRGARALWIFGAGHVGRAVVEACLPLGFEITWIDGRSGMFPDDCPDRVRRLELAMPELIVDDAPPDTVFLVMTHSHPLDQDICEAILRRGDAAYVGLIGSATKRVKFARRLLDSGLAQDDVGGLVCPIGLPQITGKQPAVIAASVAADLLIRFPDERTKSGTHALQAGDAT